MWLRRPKKAQLESEVALAEAQRNLQRIQERSSEVRAVTAASRNLLERNHFVERLEIIMGGHR